MKKYGLKIFTIVSFLLLTNSISAMSKKQVIDGIKRILATPAQNLTDQDIASFPGLLDRFVTQSRDRKTAATYQSNFDALVASRNQTRSALAAQQATAQAQAQAAAAQEAALKTELAKTRQELSDIARGAAKINEQLIAEKKKNETELNKAKDELTRVRTRLNKQLADLAKATGKDKTALIQLIQDQRADFDKKMKSGSQVLENLLQASTNRIRALINESNEQSEFIERARKNWMRLRDDLAATTGDKTKLEKDLAAAGQQLKDLEGLSDDLVKAQYAANNDIARLKDEQSRLKDEQKVAQTKFEEILAGKEKELSKARTELRRVLSESKEEFAQRQELLAKLDAKSKDLEQQALTIETLKKEVADKKQLQSSLAAIDSQRQELQAQLAALERENVKSVSAAKDAYAALKKETDKLNSDYERAKSDASVSAADKKSLSEEIDSNMEELSKWTTLARTLNQEKDALAREKSDLLAQLKGKETELATRTKDFESLKALLDRTLKGFEIAEKMRTDLEKKIKDQNTKLNNLEAQLAASQHLPAKERRALEQKYAAAREELVSRQRRLEEKLVEDTTKTRAEIAKAISERDQLKKELLAAQGKSARLSPEFKELEQSSSLYIDALKQQNAKLQADLKKQHQEFEQKQKEFITKLDKELYEKVSQLEKHQAAAVAAKKQYESFVGDERQKMKKSEEVSRAELDLSKELYAAREQLIEQDQIHKREKAKLQQSWIKEQKQYNAQIKDLEKQLAGMKEKDADRVALEERITQLREDNEQRQALIVQQDKDIQDLEQRNKIQLEKIQAEAQKQQERMQEDLQKKEAELKDAQAVAQAAKESSVTDQQKAQEKLTAAKAEFEKTLNAQKQQLSEQIDQLRKDLAQSQKSEQETKAKIAELEQEVAQGKSAAKSETAFNLKELEENERKARELRIQLEQQIRSQQVVLDSLDKKGTKKGKK